MQPERIHSSVKIEQVPEEKPIFYKPTFGEGRFPTALTFDDVLLVPQHSSVNSRSECSISSWFSKNVPLNVPIVSSPMDTVTESEMAISMAKHGGLGILHRFNSIEEQARMVRKVKRSGAFINTNPITVEPDSTYKTVRDKMMLNNVKSFLVCKAYNPDASPTLKVSRKKMVLEGILTNRDIMKFQHEDQLVKEFMTPLEQLKLIQLPDDFDRQSYDIQQLIKSSKDLAIGSKIEKIPLVNSRCEIQGLICLKDIFQYEKLKQANKAANGKLYVGAAIGANKDYIERAEKLIEEGCDVLVVDVANGHSELAGKATEILRDQFSKKADIVAGSIATGEGAEMLIRRGADGIRCGIGNGSICITRVVAGSGVPQLSALLDTVPVCEEYQIPLCSDGGNKYSGNMCKALAVGANSVMVGRLVAGCEESPGKPFMKDGKFVKMFRGMAGRNTLLMQSTPIWPSRRGRARTTSTRRHSAPKAWRAIFPLPARSSSSSKAMQTASRAG